MSGAEHPSRKAPLCLNCLHFVPTARPRQVCAHPSAPVSTVDGLPYAAACHMREELGFPGRCGPSGEWFEVALPVPVSGQNGLEVRDVPVQAIEQRHGVAVERQGVEVGGHQLGAALSGPWAKSLFDVPHCDGKPGVGLQDGLLPGQVGDGGGVHVSPCAAAVPRAESSATRRSRRLYGPAELVGKVIRSVVEYPSGERGDSCHAVFVTEDGHWLTMTAISDACEGADIQWGWANGRELTDILSPDEALEAGAVDQARYAELCAAEERREAAERAEEVARLQAKIEQLQQGGAL